MKLILTEDDGTLIETVNVTDAEFKRACISASAAWEIFNRFSVEDEDND